MVRCANPNFWLLAAVAAIAGGGVLAARYFHKKRHEDLATVALSLGFDFEQEAPSVPGELKAMLPVFMVGSDKTCSNQMIRRTGDRQFLVFDYSYTTGTGKNRTVHSQTIAAFNCGSFLPQFQLCPEHMGHKIMQLFGYQDIDFPETPEFSKRILLRGPDEAAVRSLLTMEVRMFLQGMSGWHIEGAGQWLAAYISGGTQKPQEYVSYVEQARRIAMVFGMRGLP